MNLKKKKGEGGGGGGGEEEEDIQNCIFILHEVLVLKKREAKLKERKREKKIENRK